MAYKFNALNSVAGTTYSACYKCPDRFIGDETRPNCHMTCEKYLKAREKDTQETENMNRQKRQENAARSAKIDGIKRVKNTRKRRSTR